MTKPEIIDALVAANIAHDPAATKAELEALLPAGSNSSAPKTDREARWEAFLAGYEKQNPAKFAIRKAAGELDRIPDSFN